MRTSRRGEPGEHGAVCWGHRCGNCQRVPTRCLDSLEAANVFDEIGRELW